MSMPPTVFRSLVEAIPAGEDAAFVAQVGERGRMTSRAGSVDMGSMPLTVAAIDKLNATIFPPDQLRALEQTGLAQVDFVLTGIDGTFTASAGSSPGDRWLDIRRRRTAAPASARPAAVAAAPPPAADGFADPFSDRADLAGLDFPPRAGVDADLSELTVPDDIFKRPAGGALPELAELTVPDDIFDRSAYGELTESWDGGRREAGTPEIVIADSAPVRPVPGQSARRRFRVALPVGGGLVAALLVAGYFGVIQLPFAGRSAASPPLPAVRTPPPPARAGAPPASPAPQQPTSSAAVPQAASPSETASSSVPAAPTKPSETASSSVPAAQAKSNQTASSSVPAAQAKSNQTASPSAPVAQAKPNPPAPSSLPAAQAIRSEEPARSGFSVQVAAVRTRDEADRLVARLVSQGYPAYFVRGAGAAANYYRVRIGAFPGRESAEKVAKQLEGTEGIKPWIIKETPEQKTRPSQMPPPDEPSNRR